MLSNGDINSLSNKFDGRFLLDVQLEAKRARAKFPAKKQPTFTALVEEVGEVAKAFLDESPDRIYEECVQVAVMAMRCATEGDKTLRNCQPIIAVL